MSDTFALAMIVRDGEESIARCLESVRDFVDVMHVVDTGSVDATIPIARACGAQVHEIPWPGRFDWAANTAFDLVKETWTLRIDADEWLMPGAGMEIRRAVQERPADLYTLVRADMRFDGSCSEMVMPRLTRTTARLRLVGRIHEHFPPESLRGLRIEHVHARFGHDGFSAGPDAKKIARNCALLKQEVVERPDDLYYHIELGRTLMQMGDPEGLRIVQDLADRLLTMQAQDEPPDPLTGDLLASALDAIPPEEFFSVRTDGLVRIARGWCSRSPGTMWAVSQLQLRRGRLREAFEALSELEYMLTSNDYDRLGGFQRGILERATWQNLALAAHQLGRKDIAKRNYDRWLAAEPENAQATQNLAQL